MDMTLPCFANLVEADVCDDRGSIRSPISPSPQVVANPSHPLELIGT